MGLRAAYLAVVLIWSTTPLAVKWSGEGPGFILGALGRMALAALLCLVLVAAWHRRLPWDASARRAYGAAAIGVYGAMVCVYWAAQYVPSGLIAVLFGLTPPITAVLERLLLNDRRLTATKLAGTGLGLLGLGVIFHANIELGAQSAAGIAVLLLAVLIHSLSTVLVKRQNVTLSPLALTTGALLYAVPLFLLTWVGFDGRWPAIVPAHALWSIIYLATVASVLGFTLFYYLLKHTSASAVALLTLITPITALLVGKVINDEPLTAAVGVGTALVLAGLALHQWSASSATAAATGDTDKSEA